MNTDATKELVVHNFKLTSKAIMRLEQSLDKAPNVKESFTDEEWEIIDALTSRYARTSDILFNKVFRSIDHLEFSEGGTLLDVANRTEKRGIIESVREMRKLKDIRNEISHEYAEEDIVEFYKEILDASQAILKIYKRTSLYLGSHYGIVLSNADA